MHDGRFQIDERRHHDFAGCVDLPGTPRCRKTLYLAARTHRRDHPIFDEESAVRDHAQIKK